MQDLTRATTFVQNSKKNLQLNVSENNPRNETFFFLQRIAEQNAQRLKKLRDLENDDASLLDSNEVLERFQQKQRLRRGSQTTLQDDAWLK